MHLLILGGTRFVGRYLVEAALARGHEVSMFNRGTGDPEAFPQAERLTGDRDGGLQALEGRRFDAVVDTCGFFPRIVRQSARLLAEHVGHYTYISSASVYADLSATVTEDSPVATLAPEEVEAITREGSGPLYTSAYGPLKALCEAEAEAAMPGRVLIVRAGLIVGPHDYSDRFTYWPARIGRGGDVLVPATEDRLLQFIDVRDLAEWILHAIEANTTGIFNAGGSKYSMKELAETCAHVTNSDASFTWVAPEFLTARGVQEWTELPLWLTSLPGMFDLDNSRAFASGLATRPLAETVRDTWLWDQTRPQDEERIAGMKPEREQDLLKEWHGRQ